MAAIYYIVSFWAIFVGSFKMKDRLLQLLLALLPLFIMMAVRVSWLPDDINYFDFGWSSDHGRSLSEYLIVNSLGGKLEPGYWLINQLPFQWTTVLTSLIAVSGIIIGMYNFVPQKYYSLFFFLYLYNPQFFDNIGARRFSIVVTLFIISVLLKTKGKKILPVILMIVSGLFHNTGFLFALFLLIPLNIAEKHFKLTIIVFSVAAAVFIVYPQLFLDTIISQAEDSVFEHYNDYSGVSRLTVGGLLALILNMIMAAIAIISYRKTPKDNIYSYMFLMALTYYLSRLINMSTFSRISGVVMLFTIVFLFSSIRRKRSWSSQVLIILTVLVTIYSYIRFLDGVPTMNGFYANYSSIFK